MIDFHCHILPGIDDGAKDLKEASKMLEIQRIAGVNAMILTPHFYSEEMTIEEFLARREAAWGLLDLPVEHHIRLGAEVRYCEKLLSLDLRKLTMGGTDYLLLELPELRYPAYAVHMVEELLGQRLIPILAHVERCNYFRKEPKLLKQLVDLGALAQVSAAALFDKRDHGFSVACLRHYLAQIVASDAHNTTDRKPNMDLIGKLPQELRQLHDAFTEAVWDNEFPPYIRASVPKKTLFGYR